MKCSRLEHIFSLSVYAPNLVGFNYTRQHGLLLRIWSPILLGGNSLIVALTCSGVNEICNVLFCLGCIHCISIKDSAVLYYAHTSVAKIRLSCHRFRRSRLLYHLLQWPSKRVSLCNDSTVRQPSHLRVINFRIRRTYEWSLRLIAYIGTLRPAHQLKTYVK